MHIPEQFLSYDKKTLLLVCDKKIAKLYTAFDREFQSLEQLENDRLSLDDTERYTAAIAEGKLTKGQDESLKDREGQTFYKHLAQVLFTKKQEGLFDTLILVVPQDDKNSLVGALHPEVEKTLDRVIGKQLTKVSEDQLVEKVDAERRSVANG